MAGAKVVIYQEQERQVPLLKWLDKLPSKVREKCIVKVERLAECGHELRRPLCDILQDDIYELRIKHGRTNYRILYAFVGRSIVLLSHGCTKEKRVPNIEINRAIRNRDKYLQDRKAHTYAGEL